MTTHRSSKKKSGNLACFLRHNGHSLTEKEHQQQLKQFHRRLSGRRKEKERLLQLLSCNRLVVVEGPTGSGKRYLTKHCSCVRQMTEAAQLQAQLCKVCGDTHAQGGPPTYLFDNIKGGLRELNTMGGRFTLLLEVRKRCPSNVCRFWACSARNRACSWL